MAKLVANTFSSYDLLPSEEESGQVLTYLQKAVLQNKLSTIAQDKLNVMYDPANSVDFAQQVAYLQGQLDIIVWLLDTSKSIEEVIEARNTPTDLQQPQE